MKAHPCLGFYGRLPMIVYRFEEVQANKLRPQSPKGRKILSLVSLAFDPFGLVAPFSVNMRRLLKSIWNKNGDHWDNSVEPREKEEFLKWKALLPEVAETSMDRRYFSTANEKWELHVFADASEDTKCAVVNLRSKPKEFSADLAFVIRK